MRGEALPTLLVCGLAALSVGDVRADSPADSSAINVLVSGLRNSKGGVGCVLFDSASGFPQHIDDAYRKQFVEIHGSGAECVFKDLPAGEYAVITLHDENENQKLDKTATGRPKEGYGPSNNVTHTFSAPSWNESRFALKPQSVEAIKIHMHY